MKFFSCCFCRFGVSPGLKQVETLHVSRRIDQGWIVTSNAGEFTSDFSDLYRSFGDDGELTNVEKTVPR